MQKTWLAVHKFKWLLLNTIEVSAYLYHANSVTHALAQTLTVLTRPIHAHFLYCAMAPGTVMSLHLINRENN